MGGQVSEKGIDIQIREHKRFLLLRNQERLVQSDAFRDAWDLADDEDRKEIEAALNYISPLALRHLIRDILYDDFENHTIAELRKIASEHYVKNYSRMSKETLIHTLIQKGIDDGSKRLKGDNTKST